MDITTKLLSFTERACLRRAAKLLRISDQHDAYFMQCVGVNRDNPVVSLGQCTVSLAKVPAMENVTRTEVLV